MPRKPHNQARDIEMLANVQGKLTPNQDQFVDAYVANGGNGAAAAILAGYSEKSAASAAHSLLRKSHITQEIYRRTVENIGLAAPKALGMIVGLIDKAKSDYVKLEAAKDILDRSGMRPPDRVNHKIDGDLSIKIDLG